MSKTDHRPQELEGRQRTNLQMRMQFPRIVLVNIQFCVHRTDHLQEKNSNFGGARQKHPYDRRGKVGYNSVRRRINNALWYLHQQEDTEKLHQEAHFFNKVLFLETSRCGRGAPSRPLRMKLVLSSWDCHATVSFELQEDVISREQSPRSM